jgi:exodeoxyribonuclease III
MTYRVVAWNCADNFGRKASRLKEISADIAIVPEVIQRDEAALGEYYTKIWHGEPGRRGLLLAARRPWSLSIREVAPLKHMVLVNATSADMDVLIAGVWAMPSANGYVGSVVAGLDALLPLTTGHPNVIVSGDFNASPVFDATSPATRRFGLISERLEEAGLRSIWHQTRKEIFGKESAPTYFHQWNRNQPFHIDFMFASPELRKRLTSFSIGGYDDWRPEGSDHMPLIADFAVPQGRSE